MDYSSRRLAEDHLLKINEMLHNGCSQEAITGVFNIDQLKNLAKFLGIKGYSKINKGSLQNVLFPKIEEYKKKESIRFLRGVDENGATTSFPENAKNKFVFDVLYNSMLYRVFIKDGYPQVIERLYEQVVYIPGIDDEGFIAFADDTASKKICCMLGNWFEKTPNKAHWKVEFHKLN